MAQPLSVEMQNSQGGWEALGEQRPTPLGAVWVKAEGKRQKAKVQKAEAEAENAECRMQKAEVQRAEAEGQCPAVKGPALPMEEASLASDSELLPSAFCLLPFLQSVEHMRTIGRGNLCKLPPPSPSPSWMYGRELPLAVVLDEHEVRFVKGMRAQLEALGDDWRGKNFPSGGRLGRAVFAARVLPLVPKLAGGGTLVGVSERGGVLMAQVDYSNELVTATIDASGRAWYEPVQRRNYPACCQGCPQLPVCAAGSKTMSPALAWRRLGLIEANGCADPARGYLRVFQPRRGAGGRGRTGAIRRRLSDRRSDR